MAKEEKIIPNDLPPGDDELMQYLQENLSPEQMYEIEMQMADSAFVNDAVEGLQAFNDKESIRKHTNELNLNLLKTTGKKKKRKGLKSYQQQDWMQLIAIILLLLCLLGYFMVQFFEKQLHHT